MVVDDLVVVGAEPLFLTDYIATGKVVPEKIAAIVGGIADGCVQAGCALVGGETAEHPGVMRPDEYDVSGTGVGRGERRRGPRRRTGFGPATSLIALGSSGLHSQRLLAGAPRAARRRGLGWTPTPAVLGGRTLGDELLEPTRIYARDCLALAADVRRARVRARHRRRARRQPGPGAAARRSTAIVDRSTWAPQPIFDLIAQTGSVAPRADGADVQPRRRHGRRRARRSRRRRCASGWLAGRAGRQPGGSANVRAGSTARRSRWLAPSRTGAARHEAGRVDQPGGVWRSIVRDRAAQSSSVSPSSDRARPKRRRSAVAARDRPVRAASASRSVEWELYFSSRATFCCFAFARPRPMARPPRSHGRPGSGCRLPTGPVLDAAACAGNVVIVVSPAYRAPGAFARRPRV